jgi:hypothetical protein
MHTPTRAITVRATAMALFVIALVPNLLARPVPVPGDFVIASRTYGTIYTVNPQTGTIRDLISGPELRPPPVPAILQGAGPSLASYHTSLIINSRGRLLARLSPTTPGFFGLAEINFENGNRTAVPESSAAGWLEAGDAHFKSRSEILTLADGFNASGDGRLLRHNLDSALTTVLSSRQVGAGPVFSFPRFGGWLDADTIVVADWALGGSCGVFLVDPATGDRTFLSRLSRIPFSRPTFNNGVLGENVTLGDDEGGAGPIANTGPRSLLCADGRIFVGITIQRPSQAYDGGIIEIDPATGNRTLLAGSAAVDNGLATTFVSVPPVAAPNLDSPTGLCLTPRGTIAFMLLFGPAKIYELNINTGELQIVADIAPRLQLGSQTGFCGLAVVPHPADLNYDLRVTGADLNIILAEFGKSASDLLADINNDGAVDGRDLSVLLTGFGWGTAQ